MKKNSFLFISFLAFSVVSFAQINFPPSYVEVEITGIESCAPGDQTVNFDVTWDYGQPILTPEIFYFRLKIENTYNNNGPVFSVNAFIQNWVTNRGGFISANPNAAGFYHVFLPNGGHVKDDPSNPYMKTITIATKLDPVAPAGTGGPGGVAAPGNPQPRIWVSHFKTYTSLSDTWTLLDDHNDYNSVIIDCIGGYRAAAPESDLTDSNIDISIWPNPTSSTLNISQVQDLDYINIYSSTGILQDSKVLMANQKLSIGHLNSGHYILEIILKDGNRKHIKFSKL